MTNNISRVVKAGDFVMERVRSAAVTIAAGADGHADVELTKAGYKLIGINGFYKSGTGTDYCYFYEYWLDDGTLGIVARPYARAYFHNVGNTAATFTVDFIVLYVKE